MSFVAVLWALSKEIPRTQKLLLVALASHASKEDGSCYPKIRTLAREASLSVRSVHRVLPALEEASLVRVERKYSGRARLPHKYWLPCPSEGRRAAMNKRATDRSPYDSFGRGENHYLNHKFARQDKKRVLDRKRMTREQLTEHEAQTELARRLGKEGWEILATFSEEVPRLCAELRLGTLTPARLLELRARFIELGGGST